MLQLVKAVNNWSVEIDRTGVYLLNNSDHNNTISVHRSVSDDSLSITHNNKCVNINTLRGAQRYISTNFKNEQVLSAEIYMCFTRAF